ncbi:MAG TPA: protein-disulfide reductase DsbD N-terminal domain-containing protein [Vicinamibacterales bacterium]
MKVQVSTIVLAVLAVAVPSAQSFLKNQPQRVSVEARAVAGRGAGRFELQIAVTPKPGMHVYAPGNKGYTAVGVTLQPVEGVTFGTPVYPKAETYFFAPLKETVLVYSTPFTLRVPVRVTGGAATIRGTLDYQACDDRLCYPPRSAPFTVTVPPPKGAAERTR